MRGLMCSLIEYQTITTTLSRCKENRRELEKLITIARKGGLSNRRIVISRLNDLESANLLVDVIAPQIKRDSGYLRIERAGFRRGDNAEMRTHRDRVARLILPLQRYFVLQCLPQRERDRGLDCHQTQREEARYALQLRIITPLLPREEILPHSILR